MAKDSLELTLAHRVERPASKGATLQQVQRGARLGHDEHIGEEEEHAGPRLSPRRDHQQPALPEEPATCGARGAVIPGQLQTPGPQGEGTGSRGNKGRRLRVQRKQVRKGQLEGEVAANLLSVPWPGVHRAEPGHVGGAGHSCVSAQWRGLSGLSRLSAWQPLEHTPSPLPAQL